MDWKKMYQLLRDRSYLATTSFVYALVAYLFLVLPFGVQHVYPLVLVLSIPGHIWGTLFLTAAVLAIAAVFQKSSIWQKVALVVAACVAGGLTAVFAWHVVMGSVAAVIPTIVWGYITVTHAIMLKYHDPHILSIIQKDIDLLKQEIAQIKQNR